MIWINRPAAGRSECHDAVRLQGGTPLYSARDCPSGRDLETVGMLIGLDVAGHALQSRLLRDMRIPTKPATHSNRKPATDSDLKPAGVPI